MTTSRAEGAETVTPKNVFRENIARIVRRFHSNSCYPDATKFELDCVTHEIISLVGNRATPAQIAAEKTLRGAGYTYTEGAELWRPPVIPRVVTEEMVDRTAKTDHKIINEVSDVARIVLRNMRPGYEAPPDHKFWVCSNPRSRQAWGAAVEIYELITCTEVHDALLTVEEGDEEQLAALAVQPASDVGPGLRLAEALVGDHKYNFQGMEDENGLAGMFARGNRNAVRKIGAAISAELARVEGRKA